MADIIFPDGTTLASLAPNSGNLLASFTPTFSGWDVNPGTNSDLVRELQNTMLTTYGKVPAWGTGYIIYDLGSSKRVMVWMSANTSAGSTSLLIGASDDGSLYYYVANSEITYSAGCGVVKARYLRFSITNLTGSQRTLSVIGCRAYLL